MTMRSAVAMPRASSPFSSAVLIRDGNMEPELCHGSVAFLADTTGFAYDALYAIEHDGQYAGIYRAQSIGGGQVRMWLDKSPCRTDLSREDFRAINARLVVGVAQPYTPEFRDFLRDRFMGDQP